MQNFEHKSDFTRYPESNTSSGTVGGHTTRGRIMETYRELGLEDKVELMEGSDYRNQNNSEEAKKALMA